MIEWWEKLSNFESKDTGWKVFYPPHMNKVDQRYTSIHSELEPETSKLALIDEVVRDYMKLEPITNDFFNQFTQCI